MVQNEIKEHSSLYHTRMLGATKTVTATGFRLLLLLIREADMPNRLSKKHSGSSGNVLFMNVENKKEWATELGIGVGSINNLVTELCRRELILRKKSAIYILNPEYIFKGTWVQRQEAMVELGYDKQITII